MTYLPNSSAGQCAERYILSQLFKLLMARSLPRLSSAKSCLGNLARDVAVWRTMAATGDTGLGENRVE
jgi:hypothetical protein